jgi:hypothetical protein
MLTIEQFAFENQSVVEYQQTESTWTSTANVVSQNGAWKEQSLTVLEPRLAGFSISDACVLWGYFPSRNNQVLFDRMHHNAEDRGEKLLPAEAPQKTKTKLGALYAQAEAFGGENFLLAGPTDNFWHFLYNFALRLAFVKNKFGSLEASPYQFVVPDDLKPDFLSALHRMGLSPDRIRPISLAKPARFESLFVTELPFLFTRKHLHGSRFASRSMFGKQGAPGDAKIYISRSDARWRKIVNEQQIIETLQQHGFKIIRLTDYNLDELAALMSSARIVVGSSGANLAPTAYCNPGTVVIELSYHPMVGKYYFQMSSTANELVHVKVAGEPEKTDNSYHLWNFNISHKALLEALDAAMVL